MSAVQQSHACFFGGWNTKNVGFSHWDKMWRISEMRLNQFIFKLLQSLWKLSGKHFQQFSKWNNPQCNTTAHNKDKIGCNYLGLFLINTIFWQTDTKIIVTSSQYLHCRTFIDLFLILLDYTKLTSEEKQTYILNRLSLLKKHNFVEIFCIMLYLSLFYIIVKICKQDTEVLRISPCTKVW